MEYHAEALLGLSALLDFLALLELSALLDVLALLDWTGQSLLETTRQGSESLARASGGRVVPHFEDPVYTVKDRPPLREANPILRQGRKEMREGREG